QGTVKQEDVLYVIVQGPDGSIRAWGKAAQLAQIPPLEHRRGAPQRDPRFDNKTEVFRFRWGSDEVYEIVQRITTRRGRSREEIGLSVGGEEQTIGLTRIGMSLAVQPIDEAVGRVKLTIMLVTSLVIAVGILATVFLVKFMMRPVRELVDAAGRIER